MNKIKIGNKFIGQEEPCFIIAEAGVNHNGSLDLAKKLVDVAKSSGADAIKFQSFKTENLVTKEVGTADYHKKNTGKKESQYEMLKKLELSYEDFKELKKYCDKKRIIFLSTPHTEGVIDFLEPLVSAFKIGSADLNNIPFLEKIAKKDKPIILSTGMATLEEIEEAVSAIEKTGNKKIIILHCTTNYPCPDNEVNLRVINTLKENFDYSIGFSDHTLGIKASTLASAMDVAIIEKHFTLDKNMQGPDHKASMNPDELKKIVEEIRNAEVIMGTRSKKLTENEKKIMQLVRKSIVANKDIKVGTKITEDMLIIKRPGTGISPKEMNKVIGKKATTNIKKDEILKYNMLS